jgi:hypothetical protein
VADLLQIDMLFLVGERRVAPDHQHPAHARHISGQAFGHAIDEIFQLGIAAYVREGQNHNGKSRRPSSAVSCSDADPDVAVYASGVPDRLSPS